MSFLSTKKTNVVVSGCSFTDPRFVSKVYPDYDCNFSRWPDYVGDYYDWNIINVARSGAGNDYLIENALNAIFTNNKIDKCVLALTEWHRFHVLRYLYNPKLYFHFKEDSGFFEGWKTPYNKYHESYLTEKTLFLLKIMIEICEARDIELIVFQIIRPASGNEYLSFRELGNVLVKSPHFHSIEKHLKQNPKLHFLGWPFYEELLGYNFDKKHLWNRGEDGMLPAWRIGPEDYHPNALGHKLLAKSFIEEYEESMKKSK